MQLADQLIVLAAEARRLRITLEQLLSSFISQLGSDHGTQVVIGHFVEELVEAELAKLNHMLSYKRTNEKTEKGDFHVVFHDHPGIVIVIEAKTGQWKGNYTRKHDLKKNPNGSVSVGVCKSRLTGIDKLYERRRFNIVATGFLTKDGWFVRACLTSDMPAHKKHPEMLGERQTFPLDVKTSRWRLIEDVLLEALEQEIHNQSSSVLQSE